MLTKEEYIDIIDFLDFFYSDNLIATAELRKEKSKELQKEDVMNFKSKLDKLKQLIEEHFGLQLTRSECDLIEVALKPSEEELGMDITLLIDKLRRIQNTLPKEEGVVTCVEID